MLENDVEIRTADGVCNAGFYHPEEGSYPAVIIWADAFGLRPATREMAKRLAGEGYAVLVPNPFYREVREVPMDPATFDFSNPADVAKLRPLLASATIPANVETDTAALATFLEQEPAVNSHAQMGVQGYCMGGQMAVRTAALLGARVGAAAAFHANGLATDKADSPHLLGSQIKAEMYFGVAGSDDAKDPTMRGKLKQALEEAGVAVEVELYPEAQHGWCMPDFPAYRAEDAERAWGKLLELYKRRLAG